ncbi:hypothetical protein LTR48_004415 [Friedmanniomyces endolithicus]|uniref:Uncharacterized protein n=1 Tax=Rachicladosporium monterosium TaxID=1507873 RepID=A0ABR0L589_9PEZI|nr:hypothetical protein LTR29_007852 [Friedmanniomyces endolithicus]KAK1092395.1 hypothetical protein LTR48_004415 [Friedmanniomyces endolithicus]KAK5143721.1 hypothetical protein LTR32_004202 [Rachicladosporium monterosium]
MPEHQFLRRCRKHLNTREARFAMRLINAGFSPDRSSVHTVPQDPNELRVVPQAVSEVLVSQENRFGVDGSEATRRRDLSWALNSCKLPISSGVGGNGRLR